MTEWLTNKAAHLYLRYWTISLDKLLGWDHARVVSWAMQFKDSLNDENSILYHETPSYFIASLLVPKMQLSKLSAKALRELQGHIERALHTPDYRAESLSRYEWDLAKQRINDVLREHTGLENSLELVRDQSK